MNGKRFIYISFLSVIILSHGFLQMNQNVEAEETNPLLLGEGLPRFDIIKPEHVVPAISQVLEQSKQDLAIAEKNITPTWDSLIRPFDELGKVYEQTISPVLHLQTVKNSPELRQAYIEIIGDFFTTLQRFQQSQPIYEGFVELRNSEEWEGLTKTQKRTVNLRILEAELAGVGLKGDARKRYNEIIMEKAELGNKYNNNLQDANPNYS